MKTAKELLEKQLQNLVTSYANMIWNNNQELDFNVEKAIKLEEAIWDWIKANFTPKAEIKALINEIIEEYKDITKQTKNDNDALIYAQGIIALTELKEKL